MEAVLIKIYSKAKNLAVTEEANFDEAIPIDLKKEKIIEAYK